MENTIEHPATAATTPTEVESYQALLARAHRKTGAVPPELMVRHILAVTAEADWPVRREALEALLRRVAFGKADGLQIVSRPGGGRLLGLYATRRKGSPARPYRTLLRRLDPIMGHCDCADFLRSSLGLCKHLLAVAGGRRREAARLRQGQAGACLERVATAMGPGPPAHRSGRLAGAGPLGRRHARRGSPAVAASREGGRLDARSPRAARAAATGRGETPRRARGWARAASGVDCSSSPPRSSPSGSASGNSSPTRPPP